MNDKRRALVFLLPGLGDALVASPVLRVLRNAHYKIDVLTMLRPVSEYAAQLSEVDGVFELPLLSAPRNALPGLLRLRSAQYQTVVVPFPATRWQYAFIAAIVRGKRTLMHRYGGMASLLGHLVGAEQINLRGGHRVYENARLVASIGFTNTIQYCVPANWWREKRPELLAIHPGTMRYKGNEARRWPVDRFAEVARMQIEAGRQVRVFFGPNETDDLEYFRVTLKGLKADLVAEPLEGAAQLLAECEVLLANDSGFAHLGAALGVKTLTLFGMTNPTRANPVGPSKALRLSPCPPCHDEGLRRFECVKDLDFRCIRTDLDVTAVNSNLSQLFAQPVDYRAEQAGPYRLYNISHI